MPRGREGTGRGAAALPRNASRGPVHRCVFLGTGVAQTASSLSLTEGPEAPVLTADSNEP